ncbi:hypothetical protein R3P38DRAFT_2766000 [Favolaschia claudopus]|uniref:Uncharacterized protein n=1 Tax=Favolaschia claudopus TaxID=2862362 RepID=A0AAW0CY62_9AGAR
MTSIRSSLTQFVINLSWDPRKKCGSLVRINSNGEDSNGGARCYENRPPPLFPSHRNNNMTQPKKGRINNKNKDPSAAAEAKRIASATYYRQKAQIKANRRKSDKSRPKKKRITKQGEQQPWFGRREKESTEVLASRSRSPARPGHADRSAFGVEDEDEDSDEFEEGMGMRTISEVAGDPHGIGSAPEIDWELSPITRQEQVSQEEQASDVPIPASSSL